MINLFLHHTGGAAHCGVHLTITDLAQMQDHKVKAKKSCAETGARSVLVACTLRGPSPTLTGFFYRLHASAQHKYKGGGSNVAFTSHDGCSRANHPNPSSGTP